MVNGAWKPRTETTATITSSIKRFSEAIQRLEASRILERVQVIMVDKDLQEIRVLRSYFIKARVLICLFHGIKYLDVKSHDTARFGVISARDHDAVNHIIHNMVYAVSEEVYKDNLSALDELCRRTKFTRFFDYLRRIGMTVLTCGSCTIAPSSRTSASTQTTIWRVFSGG